MKLERVWLVDKSINVSGVSNGLLMTRPDNNVHQGVKTLELVEIMGAHYVRVERPEFEAAPVSHVPMSAVGSFVIEDEPKVTGATLPKVGIKVDKEVLNVLGPQPKKVTKKRTRSKKKV